MEGNAEQKMQVSLETFTRLYQMYGVEVSWAKHPPSVLTGRFISAVLERRVNPVIVDLGCGDGSKVFDMVHKYEVTVKGYDASAIAIEIAQRQARELNLNGRVNFVCQDITRLDPHKVEKVDGVHDYQCINHIAREYHNDVVQLIAGILPTGGVFLTNSFCRETTNFYGEDISQRENGELIFKGKQGIDGMYCYFFTREEITGLYSPFFDIDSIIRVVHPSIAERFHWEALMRRK